ncbi:MAG: YbaB/EbfC family nucleoid-associated protein [Pirellulaceae bacterium]|nr:YbaB/EbfC family nucleoid-associated protein [Pirellulaceae bacterium]
MLKGLGNLASLLRSAQEMSGKMQAVNHQLKGQFVTGTSGGGMIQVQANGLGEIAQVKIDPQLVERGEREMIEDLLPAAVNQALGKARQLQADAMQEMAAGMNLPGLGDALTGLAGGGESRD